MGDNEQPNNKGYAINCKNHDDVEKSPAIIKKCHFLEGKYFIVIDESIIKKLGLSDYNIYFSEEVTDGLLLLRPETISNLN